MIRVVVFTGGRGAGVLSERLLRDPQIQLTLAVNGYDDGASTGEVRRFLGDALGPSDFRKNAARVAKVTGTCSPALVALVEHRLPAAIDEATAIRWLEALAGNGSSDENQGAVAETGLFAGLTPAERVVVGQRLRAFLCALRDTGRPFSFGDCAVGNLVFAGSYLRAGRRFNDAVDDFAGLLGLAPGVIENVTDGTNASLVALDLEGHVLGTEEAIVDSRGRHRIKDIFLLDVPLTDEMARELTGRGEAAARQFFAEHAATVGLNQRLAGALQAADVIVYAPGTQHSSLFPSYLTPGLVDAIAGNLGAIKLFITNLKYDAEIADASAVTLVGRALYYLAGKGSVAIPAPCLITHYLLNEPGRDDTAPYLPLGQVDSLEDPRLVRIGSYEDAVTGRHDAAKVLEPFIESLLSPPNAPAVALFLYGTRSADKLAQTLIEIVRSRVDHTRAPLRVYAVRAPSLTPAFLDRLPFPVVLFDDEAAAERALRQSIARGEAQYVVLFDSSGMYRGEDLAGLFRYLGDGRLDAVWGSRRLSVRDIEESFRYHYFQTPVLRGITRVGSHLLSAAYLLLYGRYVADTLSGLRIVRAADVGQVQLPLTDKLFNQHVLSRLLRRRADVLEVPVRFIALSPERVKRTGIGEGLRSLAAIVWYRLRPAA